MNEHEYYCQQCSEYFDTLNELNEHDRTNGEFKNDA